MQTATRVRRRQRRTRGRQPPQRSELPRTLVVTLWLAFMIPLVYESWILSTATHEAIGHWGAMAMTGWEAVEIQINLDGSGYVAYHGFTSRPTGNIAPWNGSFLVPAGGVLSTFLVGVVFLVVGLRLSRRPLLSTAALLLAWFHLLDGPIYILLDAPEPYTFGDINWILSLPGFEEFRTPMLVVAALAIPLFSLLITSQVYRRVETMLGPQSTLSAGFLVLILGTVLVSQLGWLWTMEGRFDDPSLPLIATGASQLLAGALIVLGRRRRFRVRALSGRQWSAGIAVAWFLLVLTILTLKTSGLHEGLELVENGGWAFE